MTSQTPHAEQKHKGTPQREGPVRERPKPAVEMAAEPDLLALQRAVLNPAQAAPGDILGLQRTAGNRAVSRLIQTKLTVGGAGDRYEQEADRVAEQVVSSQWSRPTSASDANSQPGIQRQGEEEEVQTKPLAATITPVVQRQEEEEEIQTKPLLQRQEEEEEVQTKPLVQRQAEEEEIQTKPLVQRQQEEEEVQTKPLLQRQTAADGSFEAGSSLEKRLAAHKGGGSPLPEQVRGHMESRFGTSFGSVRVHTDAAAVQMNRELSAQAFTHGRDIYMRPDKYDPGAEAGKKLLAHELTHVVQQRGASDRIARWGKGLPAYGTSHTIVSTKAYEKMDKDLVADYGRDALAYLATHADDMDMRVGYLLPVKRFMMKQSKAKKKKRGMFAGEVTPEQIKKKFGKKQAKKGIPQSTILALEEAEKRKRAKDYDEGIGYIRNPAEAPNHAEGGMYKDMSGEGRDRARIEEYLDNAVSQWWSGNPRQSMYTLSLALHTAQDIGAHGHGQPGTGHDPRRFTPPPNEYTNKGWVYYDTGMGKHGENMPFGFCDNIGDNPDGLAIAIEETHKLLTDFRDRVQGEGGGIKQGWSKPGFMKDLIRGAGRLFGGRGIIKHK
jgi:Domain of unknown function (DUF4157)